MWRKEGYQTAFQMKKIIVKWSTIWSYLFLIVLSSCSSSPDQKEQQPTEPWSLRTVVAVGKVVPEGGWQVVASPVQGRIDEVLAREGDTLRAGQVIFRLAQHHEDLDVRQHRFALENMQQLQGVNRTELRQAEIQLQTLKSQWETSMALYRKHAETKEQLDADRTAFLQQEERVRGLQRQLDADKAKQKEQTISIEKAERDLADLQIRARQDGLLTDVTVDPGQSVNPGDELAQMVGQRALLIEAEVDELFADSVRLGQRVTFQSGRVTGQGVVSFLGPVLQNKSILYETANEAEDRRVRPIRITPEHDQGLLINTKVECRIQIN